jgi:hypothetical protein
MYASDVRAVRVTGVGALGAGRSRLGAFIATIGAGAGRLTITDGDGGPVILDLDFSPSDTHHITFPGDGCLFESDPHISVSTNVTAVTLFLV